MAYSCSTSHRSGNRSSKVSSFSSLLHWTASVSAVHTRHNRTQGSGTRPPNSTECTTRLSFLTNHKHVRPPDKPCSTAFNLDFQLAIHRSLRDNLHVESRLTSGPDWDSRPGESDDPEARCFSA